MGRSERRAVGEVHRDRAGNDARSTPPPGLNDVLQIALKTFSDGVHARIVRAHLAIHEHGHTAPFRTGTSALTDGFEQLPRAQALEPKAGPNERQWRRLPAEYRPRAEGTHHFVIAHIDHPNIGLCLGAVV